MEEDGDDGDEVQGTFVTVDDMDDYRWMEVELPSFLISPQDLGVW
jgi:hypothetical protein